MPTPITINVNFIDLTGNTVSGYMQAAIISPTGVYDLYVTGTGIIVPKITTSSTGTSVSVVVWGNDIVVDSADGLKDTYYTVNLFNSSNVLIWTAAYTFTGAGPINLVGYPPLTLLPSPPSGPVPTNILTSNNIFTGTNAFNSTATFSGTVTHSGTETFTGPFLQKFNPIFDIRAYGGACDNATDNVTAFNAALVDAQNAGGGTILFPLGVCLFNSKPDNIGNGVKLQGQGWSTNTLVGTSLLRNYADAGTLGFITFDGNFGTAKGTGSGVDDLTIGPVTSQTGGYLLKITSTPGCVVGSDCDNHRASDTKITNVFLGNGNGGTTACGLYIDGSQLTTPGTQAIRIVNINNLRVSSTTTANCSVFANNVTHFFGNNIEIDTGNGATPGVTITGVGVAPNSAASANVYFSNMELVGDLVIDSASGVQTSGSVLVNGTTSTSANTANSILLGRFATIPSNSSATSTWATVKSAVPFVVPALAATSTGVLTGAAGEVFSITGATTGVLGMGSDHNVTFNRFASDKIGFTGSMFCATTTCSTGMNAGDFQSASSATGGSLWLGTDALSFITRNAAGDINSKQKLGFRDGTAFLGLFASPLTTARTWTFPDASGTALLSGNTNTVLQTARVNGCATAASLNATCDTTVTWTTAFANANYTATCVGDVVTSGVPVIQGIDISAAKTGAAITVRTISITAAAAQFTAI